MYDVGFITKEGNLVHCDICNELLLRYGLIECLCAIQKIYQCEIVSVQRVDLKKGSENNV